VIHMYVKISVLSSGTSGFVTRCFIYFVLDAAMSNFGMHESFQLALWLWEVEVMPSPESKWD